MDQGLKERLVKIDEHILKLFHVEHEFFELDGSKKALLASLTKEAAGKSQAEKEMIALSGAPWMDFIKGHSLKEAEYNRERRRYELLMKAFDAEYATFKIEAQVIKRQL